MKPSKEMKMWPPIYRSRFLLLFISIVLSFAVRPFLEGSLEAFFLSGIFFSFILLACIYSVSGTRGVFVVALSLGLPSIGAVWLGILLVNSSIQMAGAGL